MCGRYVSASPPDELARYFEAALGPGVEAEPSYNVAPTNAVPAVRARDGHRELERLHWGLVPSWAKERKIGSRMINARAETAAEKPAFRRALSKRRCLIPADGFYEWEPIEGQKQKQPWYIQHRDAEPLVFAGLWEAWRDPAEVAAAEADGRDPSEVDWLISTTILTTAPNEEMSTIHHRMPVLVPPSSWDRWLDPANGTDDVASLMVSAPDGLLRLHPVSTAVNRVGNKGPELIEEMGRA